MKEWMVFVYLFIGVGAIIHFICIPLARWRLFGRRLSMSLEEQYRTLPPNSNVPFDFFVRMMSLIAKLYHLPVEKLRLEDDFDGDFRKVGKYGNIDNQRPKRKFVEIGRNWLLGWCSTSMISSRGAQERRNA